MSVKKSGESSLTESENYVIVISSDSESTEPESSNYNNDYVPSTTESPAATVSTPSNMVLSHEQTNQKENTALCYTHPTYSTLPAVLCEQQEQLNVIQPSVNSNLSNIHLFSEMRDGETNQMLETSQVTTDSQPCIQVTEPISNPLEGTSQQVHTTPQDNTSTHSENGRRATPLRPKALYPHEVASRMYPEYFYNPLHIFATIYPDATYYGRQFYSCRSI
ncbi:hypothetical protein THOM_1984, partial [Trachipleistophora hominis]